MAYFIRCEHRLAAWRAARHDGSATVFGRKYRLRSTYTKQSNDAFTLVNEEQRPDGTWLRDDEYDYVHAKP